MESKTKNKKTRAQIAKMVERAFNGVTLAAGDGAVGELKEGWFNVAYDIRLADGREVILKIAPPAGAEILQYEKDIMVTEVAAMRMAHQNPRIPVPEIYFADEARDICDSLYFFMEKLSGENLEHVKNTLTPEVKTRVYTQIGEIIREINGFTGTYFGYEGNSELRAATWNEAFIKIMESVLADGERKKAEYGFSYADVRDTYLKHVDSLDAITTPCLVHWDAWDSNFFVKDGRISGILDFERALWAEPLMEAQFRALFFEGVTDSLRGYGKTEFTPEEQIRCLLYTLHLALVMNTECYYRHYDTDEVYNISMQMIAGAMHGLKAV